MKFSEVSIGDIYESRNCGFYEVVDKVQGKSPKVVVKFLNTGYITTVKVWECSNGSIKDRLLPSRFGVGYLGEGKYNYYDGDGKATVCGVKWKSMLERCYCPKYQERYPCYKGCSVDVDWHNFQNFAKWFYSTYPSDGLYYELDKDSRLLGNKVYSKDTCTWLTKESNIAFSKQKTYKFFDPEGNYVEVVNLKQFCLGKDLIRELMGKVYNGKRKHHKGWTKAD